MYSVLAAYLRLNGTAEPRRESPEPDALDEVGQSIVTILGARTGERRLGDQSSRFPLLRGARLARVSLRSLDFGGTDFTKAALINADAYSAKLQRSSFVDALLDGAELTGANLRFADMRSAMLRNNANLNKADLTGADFNGSRLGGTILIRA